MSSAKMNICMQPLSIKRSGSQSVGGDPFSKPLSLKNIYIPIHHGSKITVMTLSTKITMVFRHHNISNCMKGSEH